MKMNSIVENTGSCTCDEVVKKKKIPYYVEFCEELFSVEPNKRCEYLYSMNIPAFKLCDYFNNYMNSNGRYVKELAAFRVEYSEYKKNKRLELINYEKKLKYKKICAFFDRVINDGFCSMYDYKNFSTDDNSVKAKVDEYVDFIKREDSKKWESYVSAMNENKKNLLIKFNERIAEFKNMIVSGNADIIDYYTVIGMPRVRFKKVFYDNFSFLDKALFNKFFERYKFIPEGFNAEELAKTSYSNSKVEISDDVKSAIADFMRTYDIPVQFYPIALNKYISGQLDIKVKSLKKEF